MKKLFAFALFLSLFGRAGAQTVEAINITLFTSYGLHSVQLLIGSESEKVNNIYNRLGSDIPDTVSKSFQIHKHLVRPEVEQYLLLFIYINWSPFKAAIERGKNVYYIGTYNKSETSESILTVLDNEKEARKYFSAMREWIERSPYRKECKYLLADILQKFIEGKEFPLTQYQEQIIKVKEIEKRKR